MANGYSALFSVYSSIVAKNVDSDVETNYGSNAFFSNGYNIIGVGNGTAAFVKPGDQVGITDPMLGPLANNGGPTLTHALLPSSLALNAGNPSASPGVNNVPINDQRGVPFIRIYGGRIDVGAFELQPTAYVLGDFNRDGFVDSSDYAIFRKQLNQTVVPGTGADANGDGIVDNTDYLIWKSNYGRTQTQLPQSPSAAPGMALSERVTASEQPATLSQASLSGSSSLPSVVPQFVLSLRASRTSLRSSNHALRSPKASSDLVARTARFDYAIEAWSRPMDGTNKRRFFESDAGPFSVVDCTEGRLESPPSAGLVVDEAFALL
jgi:hypothetical protein